MFVEEGWQYSGEEKKNDFRESFDCMSTVPIYKNIISETFAMNFVLGINVAQSSELLCQSMLTVWQEENDDSIRINR